VAARLIASPDDSTKLFATTTMLRFRQEQRDIFDLGDYQPIPVMGSRAAHLFAFARTLGSRHAIVAVPRLVATLTPDANVLPLGERIWGDTRLDLTGLPETASYHEALTDRCVAIQREGPLALRAADLFEGFPIAVLAG
jgi:(1->4)-alpha-D-glucan 1-alpha-D-glucosylmutase